MFVDRLEQGSIHTAVAESASFNGRENSGKLRGTLLERQGAVAIVQSDLLYLVGKVAKHEALVFSSILGDFDIGSVNCTEQQRAPKAGKRIHKNGWYYCLRQRKLHVTLMACK
jgi:hypothetical protein